MDSEFITYEVDRLGHALDADTKYPFTGHERIKVATSRGGVVIDEHMEERAMATLPPRVLEKLKAKTIYSIRGEMDLLGEVELADHIIFNGRKT